MKEIFLSFKSEYFRPLLYGIKKYEYRKRFCSEETIAYLYLSGQSRKVIGILELGIPIRLDKTRNDYVNYPDTLKRVDEYISRGVKNAIPIKSLTLFKNPLSLNDIRKEIPNFMPPQMYYVLDNQSELKRMLLSRKVGGKLFIHDHSEIYYDNLAVSVSGLMETDEYKKLNQKNIDNNEFNNIVWVCGGYIKVF